MTVCTTCATNSHPVHGAEGAQQHSHFLRTERGKRLKAPPWEFVKTFQQSESGRRIRDSPSGLALSLSSSSLNVEALQEENLKNPPEVGRTQRLSPSHWSAHNEAGVTLPCFHCLDFDCSPVLLPGADGLSGEQAAGYRGKKKNNFIAS